MHFTHGLLKGVFVGGVNKHTKAREQYLRRLILLGFTRYFDYVTFC